MNFPPLVRLCAWSMSKLSFTGKIIIITPFLFNNQFSDEIFKTKDTLFVLFWKTNKIVTIYFIVKQ